MAKNAFYHLVDSLKRPLLPTQTGPYWPYPLPETEMIARFCKIPISKCTFFMI